MIGKLRNIKIDNRLKLTVAALFVAVQLPLLFAAPSAIYADNDNNDDHNEICHATRSETNPYSHTTPPTRQEVSKHSVAGPAGHGEHKGPIFPAKDSDGKWGDIIPPFEAKEGHGGWDAFEGLNWTAEGQAIWNNNCALVTTGGQGGDDGGDVLGDNTTTAGQVAAAQVTAPTGGVGAGGGGSIAGSLFGLSASLSLLGYGAASLRKKL